MMVSRSSLLYFVATLSTIAVSASGSPGASPLPTYRLEGRPLRLTCERKETPFGIDTLTPRLSWWVGDRRPDAVQSAYQIVVGSSPAQLPEKPDVWDSGQVTSDESVDVAYRGPALASGQRYYWKVRTWDAKGQPSKWSDGQWWEMGLLSPGDWHAQWIGADSRDITRSVPALHLRKEFEIKKKIKTGRLYVSARGLFEMRVNGDRVGNDYFTPGWTDYKKRNQYLVYDLTSKLVNGTNVLGGILGDGWHNGNLLLIGGAKKNWYGQDASLLAQLVINYVDGSREIVSTDESWRISEGPILESDLYNGEYYDARKELRMGETTWDQKGFDGSNWRPAKPFPAPAEAPVAKVNLPIRKHESLAARTVRRGATGEWIFDFGQNLAGWAKIKMRGQPGQMVTLRFAEMLNPDGSLHTANLRSAKATDRYVFRGTGLETWEPQFTFHGFRYVSVSGLSVAPDLKAIEAVVVHNDMPRTGYFATSNPQVNQLQSNIWWSQRSNAYDIPMDCPQRDERLGWTGDANFFLPTATFNYDEAAFIEKWMADLRDAQGSDGRFTSYAPAPDGVNDAPAYSDGGVICPWIIYQRYGDLKILRENYAAMRAWIAYQKANSPGYIRADEGYGDWLVPTGGPPTPKDLIATAYFAHTTELMRRIAGILGKTDDERMYRELRAQIEQAFRGKYVAAGGRTLVDTPTSYAIVLAFDLLPESDRAQAAARLVEQLRSGGWKMATGFVGTPALMQVLKKMNLAEAGYGLLLQKEYPGWLYMVDLGATTIWERWNSWTPETGFGDKISDTGVGDIAMNSFNHTVWGVVGEWMYATIGGIDADTTVPGFKRFLIRPRPGGDLTSARASFDSPYGRIATSWKVESRRFRLQVTVPPNTRATVDLPDGKVTEVGAGDHQFDAELR